MEDKIITPGIPDSEFIRGNVPMTKEEVRAASISKLRLEKNSVVYDIGSGTGSVSVEIARLSKGIKVFAVDLNPEAAELTKKNLEKFGLKNAEVVQGKAPTALETLPFPTHAFIGGSNGNLFEILNVLKCKNPEIRIVLNAVTLESISKIDEIIKFYGLTDYEVVQLFITKTQKIGNHNLFKSSNPVVVFSFSFSESKIFGEKSGEEK